MKQSLVCVMAQMDSVVGDIAKNTQNIVQMTQQAQKQGADLVVFPELALIGYPPEDLLFRDSLSKRIKAAVAQILQMTRDIYLVLGYPDTLEGGLFNAVSVLYQGEIIATYYKQCLPNYLIFDERRYFLPGHQACVVNIKGFRVGLSICEDIWHDEPILQAKAAGAELLVNINASPYHLNRTLERRSQVSKQAELAGIPVLYVNRVGGQDELVFDGRSLAVNADGTIIFESAFCQQACDTVVWQAQEDSWAVSKGAHYPVLSQEAEIYWVLVQGVRDYVQKNCFNGAILGLSGGIDSALTLAIAVDALGADQVKAVMMPFHYTSDLSIELACEQANLLKVLFIQKPIADIFDTYKKILHEDLIAGALDVTEQNLQARIRGVILMALSNNSGAIVLTTGNKTEMAVGYATLYGDMAGGYAVLKDVLKTWVYRLARYRNSISPVIPEAVIERSPTAELAPNQKDEDSLPPYDLLDTLLELYIDQEVSAADMIEKGFERSTVYKVLNMVDKNEYKRRQAPLGVRVTAKSFGRDRRYPVTFQWPLGE